MNSDGVEPFSQATTPVQWISYIQLVTKSTLKSDPEILYRDGLARVIFPGEGVVVEGELLDCPEREAGMGWVVLQAEKGAVAAGSPALRELMIENSPCHLYLESIFVRNAYGHGSWEWLAFELGPTGACIQVSDDPSS